MPPYFLMNSQATSPWRKNIYFSPSSLWLLLFLFDFFCVKKITVLVDDKLNTSQQNTVTAAKACTAALASVQPSCWGQWQFLPGQYWEGCVGRTASSSGFLLMLVYWNWKGLSRWHEERSTWWRRSWGSGLIHSGEKEAKEEGKPSCCLWLCDGVGRAEKYFSQLHSASTYSTMKSQ